MNSWSLLVLLAIVSAAAADPTKGRLLVARKQREHEESNMIDSDSSGFKEEQEALLKRNHHPSITTTTAKPNRFHRSTVTKLQLVTLTILVPSFAIPIMMNLKMYRIIVTLYQCTRKPTTTSPSPPSPVNP